MKLINVNEVEKNVVEIEFSIDRPVFEEAVTKEFKKNQKNIALPGFRKGKAPRAMVEKMYGKGVFYEDALNALLPTEYEAALKESGAEAVSRPEFDIVSMEEDVVLKAKIFIKPEVEVTEYKGIAADRVIKKVTAEDVDADIKRVQERNSRTVDVTDRAAQLEDTVVIDYVGTVDGVEFAGGKAEGHNLKLGSGQFIPGFEDQIVGHNIGDEFDVNVTFPEEYHAEDLKGKAAVFAVKLNGIKFTELPELDDEFAKDVSEFNTFDEYKADVESKIADRYLKAADSAVEEKLLDAILEKFEADVPEVMYDNETENMVRDYDNRMRMQGLDLATYFKYTGQTLESMREQFRPQADRSVKTRLALEYVANTESIAVTEEEMDEEFKRIADAYGMEVEKVKESIPADVLTEDLKIRNALKFVRENAVVTDRDADEVAAAEAAEEAAKAEAEKAEAAEENK